MAYPMLHLLVAEGYSRAYPALHSDPAYYLGAIAPDAIHMREGIVPGIHKLGTHLGARGTDGLREVMAYWAETGRTPFDIGYGVHVITDRLWVAMYVKTYPALIGPNGRTLEAPYRRDAEWMDQALIWKSDQSREFKAALREAKAPENHPLLTAQELEGWRDAVVDRLAKVTGAPEGWPEIMRLAEIEAFVRDAAEGLRVMIPEGLPIR